LNVRLLMSQGDFQEGNEGSGIVSSFLVAVSVYMQKEVGVATNRLIMFVRELTPDNFDAR